MVYKKRKLKIALVGDSGVGKTALSIRLLTIETNKKFPQEIPSVCKPWHRKIDIDGYKHYAQITVSC